MFRGDKNVSDVVQPTTATENSHQQANLGTMASTTANNNPYMSSSSQSAHAGQYSGGTLHSLVNATEPSSSPSNQQHSSVGTFPQRTTEGFPPTNGTSPFGLSFGPTQASGATQGFSFSNSSATNASANSFPDFSFNNAPQGNPPRFLLNNASSGNPPPVFGPNATASNPPRLFFNNAAASSLPPSTFNPSFQEPLPSMTITPSPQKQGLSNYRPSSSSSSVTSSNNSKQMPSINNTIKMNDISTGPRKTPDRPVPVAQRSSSPGQDQDEPETSALLAENSLLAKKTNTKLRDPGDLVVDRDDPTSPLYSTKTFAELNLNSDLLKGIYSMNFHAPSKIQEIVLPHVLNDPPKNIIAQSQSGTGKTAAFSIVVLTRIDPSIQSPQALILAPTFELAVQIGSVIEKMAQFLPYIQVAYAVRDPEISKRGSRSRGKMLTESIVIGTPGTVDEWVSKLRIVDLKQIRMFVVDEADVMITTANFQRLCDDLVKELNRSNCQMMLFSATYSDEVMAFAREIIDNPVVLRLKRDKQTLTNIRQFFIRCYDSEHKYHALEEIYSQLTVGRAVIFCRTKATARALAVQLANQHHSVKELTSDLEIEVRASVIEQFRKGLFRVLISTNVTSRGIDIDDVSLVINYDMPVTPKFEPDYETYLHRIGRCGRFGKQGYTFNLIGSEKDLEIMRAIEQYFSHPIKEITVDGISQLASDE